MEAAAATAAPRCFGISDLSTPDECYALGQKLTADEDVSILVVGHGSARRVIKAPGYLDARAEACDHAAVNALAGRDPSALMELDAALG